MDRMGSTSSARGAISQTVADAQNATPSFSFTSIDGARTHVAQCKFYDKAQAYCYLEKIDEWAGEDKIDQTSALMLRNALKEKIEGLPKLEIRTARHARDYLRQYYPSGRLGELAETLLLCAHNYDVDNESVRYLAAASRNHFEGVASPRQSAPQNRRVLQASARSGPQYAQQSNYMDVYQGLSLNLAALRFRMTDILQRVDLRAESNRRAIPQVPSEVLNRALAAIRNDGLTADQAAQRFGIENEFLQTILSNNPE